MKNLKITTVGLGLITIAAACRMDKRHVIISEGDNNGSLKIEYVGRTVFNVNGTAIARITPNGYVKYKKNDQALIAESDNSGEITYQVNGGDKKTHLNANEKTFLAQAVKDMIKHGHNNN